MNNTLIVTKLNLLIEELKNFADELVLQKGMLDFQKIETKVTHMLQEMKSNNCFLECEQEVKQLEQLLNRITNIYDNFRLEISEELKNINQHKIATNSYYKVLKCSNTK